MNVPGPSRFLFAEETSFALDPRAFDAQWTLQPLAGTDEAGRGPLAGPLVAAAVILDPAADYSKLDDSKKLTENARRKAFALIRERARAWAWAALGPGEVDRLNPLKAALSAMAMAVAGLAMPPALVLADGNFCPEVPMPVRAVVKGDSRSRSIAAASIVAKVIRDDLMLAEHLKYPQYGFDRHKGYGTAAHLKALRQYGPSPCHRLTFRGVLPPTPLPGLAPDDLG